MYLYFLERGQRSPKVSSARELRLAQQNRSLGGGRVESEREMHASRGPRQSLRVAAQRDHENPGQVCARVAQRATSSGQKDPGVRRSTLEREIIRATMRQLRAQSRRARQHDRAAAHKTHANGERHESSRSRVSKVESLAQTQVRKTYYYYHYYLY